MIDYWRPDGRPVVESISPEPGGIQHELYGVETADELYGAGLELLGLWHVREATSMFERAAGVDSTHYGARVKLIECYSHPLVGREDAAVATGRLARSFVPSQADTAFLKGLHYLFVDREYSAAVSF